MALLDRALVRLLPAVPKPVVRRVSSRYIAGEELSDAVRVVRDLNADGKLATIDVLGEEITNADEALAIADAYRDSLDAFGREQLDSNVSVKLTALGLKLGYDLCRENLEAVVAHASERGNFVRIDMEDSSTTDDTLRLYRELRAAGHENVGIVLQARLKRTLADIAALAELRPNVRLCKGIYLEPAQVAFREFDAIRVSFVQTLQALWDAGCYVGVATHDEWLLDEAKRGVEARSLARDDYEFQMLLGVRAGARRRARPRGPPAADLHAVRPAVVRVLAPAAAGEPEDRRLHRGRHAQPAAARAQRLRLADADRDVVAALAAGAGLRLAAGRPAGAQVRRARSDRPEGRRHRPAAGCRGRTCRRAPGERARPIWRTTDGSELPRISSRCCGARRRRGLHAGR